MLDFSLWMPTYYEFGLNKEKSVCELIKRFGGKRVLLHYGGGSVIKSGLLGKIKKYLEDEHIFYVELGGVKANPESDMVYEGINVVRDNNIDFILAVGGGSVIDSAKAIGVGALYNGDFWDFFREDNRKIAEETLPVGVILTIAASGSESSNSMVITNSQTKMKRGNVRSDVVRPCFAIMNPSLTMTLSNYQTACGIVDIMTHIMERYFSNTENCIVTDYMCEAVLKSMLENGKKVIDCPEDYNARANIMWAGTIAHNNILGMDREQDWASHKIEHELSAKYNVAHGAGLAVIVPRWMKYVSKIHPKKFVQFNYKVFGIESDDVRLGIQKLEDFWNSLGMSSDLASVGYCKEDLDYLVEHIDYTISGTIGNYVKLTKDDVRKIYFE